MSGYYIKLCIEAEKEASTLSNQQIIDFLNTRIGKYDPHVVFISKSVGYRAALHKRGIDVSLIMYGYIEKRLAIDAIKNKLIYIE